MRTKSFAILGLGKFGQSVAETLHNMGHYVLVVDNCEESINHISANITHAILGDVTDEALIKSLDLKNFDAAIVAIGDNIQSSILSTLLLKEAGVKYILAKAQNELHATVLKKIGANKVILPEKDIGIRVAYSLVTPNVLDLIELSPEYSIVEMTVPENWAGKSLKDSKIRNKYGINIIAVKNGNSLIVAPSADYVIKNDDTLVIIGSNSDISKIGK